MIYTKLDRFYQLSIIGWGVGTVVIDFMYNDPNNLLIGLFGLIATIIIYSFYLKVFDKRFKVNKEK